MDESSRSSNGNGTIDPIWTSSRTARQIYALGEVDKDIAKLLSLAASSTALLTLPQTDDADAGLPQGEERSEQFVLEVSEFFERLDQVHINIRSTLAHIRQARISPSIINSPAPDFIPRSSGVKIPSEDGRNNEELGFQEERVNHDAWRRVVDALTGLKATRDQENASAK